VVVKRTVAVPPMSKTATTTKMMSSLPLFPIEPKTFHAMLLPATAVPSADEGRSRAASAASFIFEILDPELKR